MKTVEYRLKRKLNEVFYVEPNDLGISFLTSLYKRLTAFLKTMPFIFIVPLSLIAGIIFYLILNRLLVRLVTLLQYGF